MVNTESLTAARPHEAPDEAPDGAIAKLTAKELDCLDRWLGHATAKEIARDLGISHHAVEKRLKTARLKLGVSTSLEAARIAANRKGYQQSVSQSPDLDLPDHAGQVSPTSSPWMTLKWRYPIMISASLAIVAMLATSQPTPRINPESLSTGLERTLDQEVAVANSVFDRMDRDSSGLIEEAEFVQPFAEVLGGSAAPNGTIIAVKRDDLSARQLTDVETETVRLRNDTSFIERRRTMFSLLDRNEDGVIDREEFTEGQLEGIGPKVFTVQLPAE